jgi:hypothetical protein
MHSFHEQVPYSALTSLSPTTSARSGSTRASSPPGPTRSGVRQT